MTAAAAAAAASSVVTTTSTPLILLPSETPKFLELCAPFKDAQVAALAERPWPDSEKFAQQVLAALSSYARILLQNDNAQGQQQQQQQRKFPKLYTWLIENKSEIVSAPTPRFNELLPEIALFLDEFESRVIAHQRWIQASFMTFARRTFFTGQPISIVQLLAFFFNNKIRSTQESSTQYNESHPAAAIRVAVPADLFKFVPPATIPELTISRLSNEASYAKDIDKAVTDLKKQIVDNMVANVRTQVQTAVQRLKSRSDFVHDKLLEKVMAAVPGWAGRPGTNDVLYETLNGIVQNQLIKDGFQEVAFMVYYMRVYQNVIGGVPNLPQPITVVSANPTEQAQFMQQVQDQLKTIQDGAQQAVERFRQQALAEVNRSYANNQQLQQQLQILEAARQAWVQESSKLDAANQTLQIQNNQLTITNQNQAQQIANLQGQVQAMLSTNEQLRQRVEADQKRLFDLQQQVSTLTNTIAALQEEVKRQDRLLNRKTTRSFDQPGGVSSSSSSSSSSSPTSQPGASSQADASSSSSSSTPQSQPSGDSSSSQDPKKQKK